MSLSVNLIKAYCLAKVLARRKNCLLCVWCPPRQTDHGTPLPDELATEDR